MFRFNGESFQCKQSNKPNITTVKESKQNTRNMRTDQPGDAVQIASIVTPLVVKVRAQEFSVESNGLAPVFVSLLLHFLAFYCFDCKEEFSKKIRKWKMFLGEDGASKGSRVITITEHSEKKNMCPIPSENACLCVCKIHPSVEWH